MAPLIQERIFCGELPRGTKIAFLWRIATWKIYHQTKVKKVLAESETGDEDIRIKVIISETRDCFEVNIVQQQTNGKVDGIYGIGDLIGQAAWSAKLLARQVGFHQKYVSQAVKTALKEVFKKV